MERRKEGGWKWERRCSESENKDRGLKEEEREEKKIPFKN